MDDTRQPLAQQVARHRVKALYPLCLFDDADLTELAEQAVLKPLLSHERIDAAAESEHFNYLVKGGVSLRTDSGAIDELTSRSLTAPLPLFRIDAPGLHAIALRETVLLQLPRVAVENALAQQVDTGAAERLLEQLLHDYRDEHTTLSSLPDVAMRIHRAIDGADIDIRDIAQIVITDPTLSAKLIQVANSPLYRGNRDYDSVQDAITRIGLPASQSLALSLSVERLFNTGSPEAKKLMRDCYEESLLIGCLGYVIAKKTGHFNPEKALLAGLLHNLGVVALIASNNRLASPLTGDPLTLSLQQLRAVAGHIVLSEMGFAPEMVAVAEEAEAWWRDGNERADYADITMVAKLHSLIGDPRLQRLPNLDQLPAYQRLKLGEFDPKQGLLFLKQANNVIEALQAMLR